MFTNGVKCTCLSCLCDYMSYQAQNYENTLKAEHFLPASVLEGSSSLHHQGKQHFSLARFNLT